MRNFPVCEVWLFNLLYVLLECFVKCRVVRSTLDPGPDLLKGVQISEFVRISKAKPIILDATVPNRLKDHTQYKIHFVQYCTIL